MKSEELSLSCAVKREKQSTGKKEVREMSQRAGRSQGSDGKTGQGISPLIGGQMTFMSIVLFGDI